MSEATLENLRESDCLAPLVDAAYDATVDPQRYEALLRCWEAFLVRRSEDSRQTVVRLLERIERGDDPHAAAVTAHFARAMEIFERLGRARRVEVEAQAIVDGLPAIGLVLDALGRIVALNAGARTIAPDAASARRFEELGFDDAANRRVLDWIRGRAFSGSFAFLLAPCRIGAEARQSCLIAAPIEVARAPGAGASGAEGPHFLVTTLDLSLDEEVVDAFVGAFELSAAEGAVAAALARGERPAAIAAMRGASVNTVRAQIKTATKKLGAEGASDLVRMINGFAASFRAARAVSRVAKHRLAPHGLRRSGVVTLPNGRRVGYVEQGAPLGRPALFLHSICFGPYWPDRAIEAAARKGWRLIGPWRPGCGDTDPSPEKDVEATLGVVVADIRRLLDGLEIEKALVVAHQTASIHAVRLALAAPERVSGVLAVSHLPIWRDAHISQLPARMRLIALTARYAPKLLPFLIRAAMAMVDAGDEMRLGRTFYAGCAHELKAIQRPDVFAPMAEGLVACMRQGAASFCRDAEIGLTDFSADLAAVRAPIRLLHGALDANMPPAVFEGAERLAPRLEATCLADAGNTLLYTHWPIVLDHLERLRAETGS